MSEKHCMCDMAVCHRKNSNDEVVDMIGNHDYYVGSAIYVTLGLLIFLLSLALKRRDFCTDLGSSHELLSSYNFQFKEK